jgi:HSP20 family protein
MPITDLIPWKKKTGKNVPIRHEREQPVDLLQRDFNRLFDEFFSGFGLAPLRGFGERWDAFTPRVDVVEHDQEIEVSVELPGMDKDDIDVTLSKDTLTISGEKQDKKEDHGRNYYHVERSYGSFHRSIPLPARVNERGAEAAFKKGVLTISLPKTEKAQTRKRISIQAR